MKENFQNDEFLRKRKERQKKIRNRRAKITIICLLVALLITGAILSVTVLFPIKNITAKDGEIYTAAQIIDACGIKKGDNLIIASESKALDNLKQRLPFIETVKLKRTLPDTLILKVSYAKEFAAYKVGNKYFTVSKSGWVLKEYDDQPENIMLVISDKVKCKVGTAVEFSDAGVQELSDSLTTSLTKYNLSAEYVDISDKMAIKAKIDGRFIVNFGSSKDLEPKVKHLVAMIKEIGNNETGNINLSMWDSQNTQGAFVKTEIK